MRLSIHKTVAMSAAAGACCVALGGAAYASTSTGPSTTTPAQSATSPASSATRLAAIKAKAATAINSRLSSLNASISEVNANQVITPADKTTLLNTLNGDLSGLTALAPKIAADTTVTQALTDYRSIFLNYRVYALALPQVRYAAAVDDITGAVLPRLTAAQSKLQGLLSGKDSGKNTPAVQAAMADLAKQINAITTNTTGLSASVLALTPSQYDANHAILAGPRATLVNTRGDARAARQDIKTVVAAVK